jgi:hypothetical protein
MFTSFTCIIYSTSSCLALTLRPLPTDDGNIYTRTSAVCNTYIPPLIHHSAHQTIIFTMHFRVSSISFALLALLGSASAIPAACAQQAQANQPAEASWGHCQPGQIYRFDQIIKELGTCLSPCTALRIPARSQVCTELTCYTSHRLSRKRARCTVLPRPAQCRIGRRGLHAV